MTSAHSIEVRGARAQNLKDIDVSIPHGRITVITGPSGSGKSSLALQVLHQEARRRFLEVDQDASWEAAWNPPAESVEGLLPCVALEPSQRRREPRATLADCAGFGVPFRLLAVALGKVVCPQCGRSVERHGIGSMCDQIEAIAEGNRIQILAPVGNPEGRLLGTLCEEFLAQGFLRALADGAEIQLDMKVDKNARPRDFAIVVDRIRSRAGQRQRIAEAVEHCCRIADGCVRISGDQELFFSQDHRCPEHGRVLSGLDPSMLSPASPRGRCPACAQLDAQSLQNVGCEECKGTRLARPIRSIQFHGHSLETWLATGVATVRTWVGTIAQEELTPTLRACREDLLRRLTLLQGLALGQIPVGRPADQLSSGEYRRARIAAMAAGDLNGLLCILDEPGACMGKEDSLRIQAALEALRDRGNTIVIVEHNPWLLAAADHVIELGPGAGVMGGQVLYCGPRSGLPEDWPFPALSAHSSPYARTEAPHRSGRSTPTKGNPASLQLIPESGFPVPELQVHGGEILAIAGPSGCGKTRLALGMLQPAVEAWLSGASQPSGVASFHCAGFVSVMANDAFTGGRNARSLVVTAAGMFDAIRNLYAGLPASKARGWTASQFGISSKGGRCEHCLGTGVWSTLAGHADSQCPFCRGRRYRDEILEARFRTLSIADLLDQSVDQARMALDAIPSLSRPLQMLQGTGLGYLKLGQAMDSLSGGEAQRLKLARKLQENAKGPVLFVLDEPSRGLHPEDARRLSELLQELAKSGNAIVMAENHPLLLNVSTRTLELP